MLASRRRQEDLPPLARHMPASDLSSGLALSVLHYRHANILVQYQLYPATPQWAVSAMATQNELTCLKCLILTTANVQLPLCTLLNLQSGGGIRYALINSPFLLKKFKLSFKLIKTMKPTLAIIHVILANHTHYGYTQSQYYATQVKQIQADYQKIFWVARGPSLGPV